MTEMAVVRTRGGMVESVHRVACAVVHPGRGLVASSGDPTFRTWWRSAAKPFQAMPLIEDGAARHFGLDSEQLALVCASHSSEPAHLAVADRILAAIGAAESDLACGPHPPLSTAVHREQIRTGQVATKRWSNCSGKHAGMLALARHHGWPLEGYTGVDHPVQRRLLASVSEWTGLGPGELALGVDGCTTVCYGLPLEAMALAWARFGISDDPAPRQLREAMLAHPFLVAGSGRPCTVMMEAWPGQLIAKIGAEGVYGAALPSLGLGVAIKVLDGDNKASALAMVAVARQLFGESGVAEPAGLAQRLEGWVDPPIVNTGGEVTGQHQVTGGLVFLAGSAANG